MTMAEQLTAPRAGLFTKQETPVPLDGVSIDAEISTFCARVVVTERFVNRETKPIEAVYVFPLDEGAAVCGFEAIIGGTLVVGEVREREEAFKMYDEAMEQGHGAYLLDEERPDVFQASVGNLPPGKEVLLKLTYVTELTVESGNVRFSIPTTVSPRYAPAEDHIGVGRPDAETLNPPIAWRVPYGLNLTVRVTMAGAITRLESPSHPVAVSMNGHDATVTLSQRDAALDRDFVLSIESAGLDVPQAWIERDEDGTESIAVAFVPALSDVPSPTEVIFLVDRSGSMGGKSIEEVRNALQLCLRSMIPGCSFNIVGFGSTFDRLFPESRAYDERSLADASEHVSRLQADLGGTEILPALQAVLDQARHGTLARQVVVLTDGQVTNTDAVLALAKKHAADARIFTFGIGAGASQHLVKGLARSGDGVAEFIYPGERIESKVVRQFGRLLTPAITDVRVDWDAADVVQAPSVVPPIFSGGRLLLYGLQKQRQTNAAPRRARLSADTPSGPKAWDVEIDSAKAVTGRTVVTLAARARIRELEESPDWKPRGSRQTGRKANAVTEEIIALSTRHGLISRETSFVAIERRDTPVHGDIQLRRVPIALTSGWGALDEAAPPALLFMRHPAGNVDALGTATPARAMQSARALAWSSRSDTGHRSFAELTASPRAQLLRAYGRAHEHAAPRAMHALVKLQRADGAWDLTEAFADAIGQKLRDLERELSGATGERDDVRRAWATALALAWLGQQAHDVEHEWRLLAAKARTWLDHGRAVPADGGGWADAAAKFLKAK
jgi:Vault protein inter-alpha-trypsin domain/von Willebrand factor type A domain